MAERSGLVALGDSITYGEGGIVLGVDGRSWALWLAQALDLPYTNYAVPGAVVADVVRDQLPRVRRGYAIGVLYAGVNDARSPGFDLAAFTRDVAAAAGGLAPHVDRLLVATLPLDLGRPRAGGKVVGANAAIRSAAEAAGATVLDLSDLAGWRLMLPDAVHPTALGQLEIADRAARALDATILPSAATSPRTAPRSVARFGLAWARMWLVEAFRRRREQRAVR
jgi:lysophospholipase L1-like esterase